MNKCTDTEIQELLPDLLHGSLDDRAKREVEAHLATCESCREDLDVIRTVRSAAVFAPAIDAERVARQIPPYGMDMPGVELPKRTRAVAWLVAAGLILAVVGGGSLVISKQRATPVPSIVIVDPPESMKTVSSSAAESARGLRAGSKTTAAAEAQPHGFALAANVDDLSDGNLVQLMNDMDQFDALPAAEPEPVISVDSGDSL